MSRTTTMPPGCLDRVVSCPSACNRMVVKADEVLELPQR